MKARLSIVAAACATALLVAATAQAGARGGRLILAGGGWHGGGFNSPHRGFSAGAARGLPPIAGIIHERPGLRPYVSAYGHTGTQWRGGLAGWSGVPVSHAGYGAPRYGTRRIAGFRRGYGHGRVLIYGGGYPAFGAGSSYGGSLYDGGGAGGAWQGASLQPVDDGRGEVPGWSPTGPDLPYASEPPLQSRFAEPPLAPSPYGGDPNGYAYAASEDAGAAARPRVVTVHRASAAGCACESGARTTPVVYRYGVGTAY